VSFTCRINGRRGGSAACFLRAVCAIDPPVAATQLPLLHRYLEITNRIKLRSHDNQTTMKTTLSESKCKASMGKDMRMNNKNQNDGKGSKFMNGEAEKHLIQLIQSVSFSEKRKPSLPRTHFPVVHIRNMRGRQSGCECSVVRDHDKGALKS
jgi:hypothetical protein